ncbi:MAG TPA: hypothetical protein PKY77_22100 [Phycisphaerae bacterium]|nr:hypothetical protein [Phycisphaerae bacterium]
MTACLAYGKGDRIYLAADSWGLPVVAAADLPDATANNLSKRLLLDTKVIRLQRGLDIVVLAAGGLEHWHHVLTRYERRNSPVQAAEEVKKHLENCTSTGNQVYGLVCGFDPQGIPDCYRVDRLPGSASITTRREKIEDVQPLGIGEVVGAGQKAKSVIDAGGHPLATLVEGIQGLCSKGLSVRTPIHCAVLIRNT